MISCVGPGETEFGSQTWGRAARRLSARSRLRTTKDGPTILVAIVADDRASHGKFHTAAAERANPNAVCGVVGFARAVSWSILHGELPSGTHDIAASLRARHRRSECIAFLGHKFEKVVLLDRPCSIGKHWLHIPTVKDLSCAVLEATAGTAMVRFRNGTSTGGEAFNSPVRRICQTSFTFGRTLLPLRLRWRGAFEQQI